MKIRIISDSSSNVYTLKGVDYSTVPMKIIAGDREFIDTPDLQLNEMVRFLKQYKGKSGSSCANAQEWLEAGGLMIGFEGGYVIPITTM